MKEKTINIAKGFGTIILFYTVLIIGSSIFNKFNTLKELLAYILLLLVLIVIYHKKLFQDLKNFKKDYFKISRKYLIIGICSMFIANILINPFISGIAQNEISNRASVKEFPLLSFIIMVILGPFIEEITFRGSFKDAFDNKYAFAIITGLIFGFVHTIAGLPDLRELLYILPYGTFGFFLAVAMYETDNIYTSTITHLLNNLICLVLIWIGLG